MEPISLTTEQQFELEKWRRLVSQVDRDELEELFQQLLRLVFLKEAAIQWLVRRVIQLEMGGSDG